MKRASGKAEGRTTFGRFVGFALFRAFEIVVRALPEPLAYGVSDVLAAVLDRVLGYRRAVVVSNLRSAFPEKSELDVLSLAHLFYRHLADIIIEIIKSQGLKAQQFGQYIQFCNPELVAGLLRKNKAVFILTGHYGNWEFMNMFPRLIKVKSLAVYLPPKNPYFDRYLKRGRTRFGAETVLTNDFFRKIRECQKRGIPTISLILDDQSPTRDKIDFWTLFLNQETGCSTGWEKIARKIGAAVVYLDIRKEKRGFYSYRFREICENAAGEAPLRITREFFGHLERTIRRDPAYWLWSHRRWKHRPL